MVRGMGIFQPLSGSISLSSAGDFRAVFRIVDGRVAAARYSGNSGMMIGRDGACAPIVQCCLRDWVLRSRILARSPGRSVRKLYLLEPSGRAANARVRSFGAYGFSRSDRRVPVLPLQIQGAVIPFSANSPCAFSLLPRPNPIPRRMCGALVNWMSA